MFLHLLQNGVDREAIPREVQSILSSQGQNLIKDGEVLQEADGLHVLEEKFVSFESKTGPLLQVLRIM